jgi:hypothetical protein
LNEPDTFQPEPPLIDGSPQSGCRGIVILPARDEESALPSALDALAMQIDTDGKPLCPNFFEILLLLNNCTDASASVAQRWKANHSGCRLHIIERTLPEEMAHIGTARRILMDTAWHRLQGGSRICRAILSTDADTVVARDWVAQNFRAFADGADAVGGAICLKHSDLESLPNRVRTAYMRDHLYQQLVAELEDHLDPQIGDPWPRHLAHFGASLACTPEIYALAGGMPPVRRLEDVAFVDALRRVDARLRHDLAVLVYTSARLDGRADVGLSGQLRLWQETSDLWQQHIVDSCEWLIHRFSTLRRLRALCEASSSRQWESFPWQWHGRLAEICSLHRTGAQFLMEIDCDRLIDESFRGNRFGDIVSVNRKLRHTLTRLRQELPGSCEGAA